MFCHHCGHQLPDDSAFCNICGTKLLQPETSTPGTFSAGQVSTQPGQSQPTYTYLESDTLYSSDGGSRPQNISASGLASSPRNAFPQTRNISQPPNAPIGNSLQYMPSSAENAYQQSTSSIPAQPQQSAILPPDGRMQRFLLRTFGPQLATNAVFGVLLGSIIAVVLGIFITALLVTVAHAIPLILPAALQIC